MIIALPTEITYLRLIPRAQFSEINVDPRRGATLNIVKRREISLNAPITIARAEHKHPSRGDHYSSSFINIPIPNYNTHRSYNPRYSLARFLFLSSLLSRSSSNTWARLTHRPRGKPRLGADRLCEIAVYLATVARGLSAGG